MFGVAAVVLLTLAALVAFKVFSGVSAAGLAYAGLACLALHVLYPVTPWRRAP
jgi:hypothetical protein